MRASTATPQQSQLAQSFGELNVSFVGKSGNLLLQQHLVGHGVGDGQVLLAYDLDVGQVLAHLLAHLAVVGDDRLGVGVDDDGGFVVTCARLRAGRRRRSVRTRA